MKSTYISLFLITIIIYSTSCSNEEAITPDSGNPFIGSWEISGTLSGYLRRITVTFDADMTYKYEDYYEKYDPAYSSYEAEYTFDDEFVTMDEVYPYRFSGNSLFITVDDEDQGSVEVEYKKK